MTIITNKFNLPQPIVDAIKHDTYKVGGDISVTTLIDAPQIRLLKKRHGKEIEEDVSEYMWALFGTAIHHVLERSHIKDSRKRAFLIVIETLKDEAKNYAADDQKALLNLSNKLIELIVKFFPELDSRYIFEMTLNYDYNGVFLYGTFDVYDKIEKCLYDYKVCSVWAYFYPESRKKWTAQANVYAFMLRNNGIEVNDIKIVAIFRDWSRSKAVISTKDYPSQQIMTIPIQVIPQDRMKRYVEERMDLHINAERSGAIPECSGIERWSTADEYAVMKVGLKRAIRKFESEPMANKFIRDNNHKFDQKLHIQIRPGENKRCENFCPVRDVCPQKARIDQMNEELAKEK